MANIRFGKVENNPSTTQNIPRNSIEMGISNAPARLIVKYITDMYSFPLEAAIRETVSNAVDAAMAVGIGYDGIEAYITSPNSRTGKPAYFVIKDLGAGMTADKLINVYTQYGVSDKREDDDATGAFGLGAKSPLAYTNEFEVITRSAEDGTQYVHCYRTPDDDFIADMPVSIDGHAVLSDVLAEMHGFTGSTIEVDDPFKADETGTLVRFPLKYDDADKATIILNSIDELVYECGEGTIIASERSHEPANFFVGEYEISDKSGDTVTAKIYLFDNDPSHNGRSYNSRQLSTVLQSIYNGDGILDERLVAFKVGCWCYPADGSLWTRKRYGSVVHPVIIDVPSKALPFVPSRDTIRNDNANPAGLREFASECLRDFFTDKNNATEAFAWSVQGTSFQSAAKMTFPFSSTRFSLSDDKVLTVVNTTTTFPFKMEIDLCKIPGLAGYSVADLLTSKPAMIGLVDKTTTPKMKYGPLMCSDNDIARLIGINAADENNAHHVGWGYAKTRTCADTLTAFGDEGVKGAEYHTADMRKAQHSYRSSAQSSPKYPVGLALMHEIPEHHGNLRFVIIDGTVTPISKIRAGISRIFENKSIFADNESGEALFAIIPPKGNGNWTANELAEQVDFLKTIGKSFAGENVTYIPESEMTAALAKVVKGNITGKERSELEKMLNVNRIFKLCDPLASRSYDAVRIMRGKSEVAAKLIEDPTSWGIIIADNNDTTSSPLYEIAVNYAQAAYALGMVPSRITNIVGIGTNHYNEKRANMLSSLGVEVIYDESGKTPFAPVIEKGTLAYREHRVVYSGKELPEEIELYAANAAFERSELELRRIWEGPLSSYVGYSWNSTHEIQRPSNAQFVDLLTFGHESLDERAEAVSEIALWRRDILNNMVFDSETAHVERDLTELKQKLVDVVSIWLAKGEQAGLDWNTNKWDARNLMGVRGAAEGSGIDSSIEAYYNGVPISDIIS